MFSSFQIALDFKPGEVSPVADPIIVEKLLFFGVVVDDPVPGIVGVAIDSPAIS